MPRFGTPPCRSDLIPSDFNTEIGDVKETILIRRPVAAAVRNGPEAAHGDVGAVRSGLGAVVGVRERRDAGAFTQWKAACGGGCC